MTLVLYVIYKTLSVTKILYYWEIFYYSSFTIRRFHCNMRSIFFPPSLYYVSL